MCEVKYCRATTSDVIYYGHEVCWEHWEEHCNGIRNLAEEFKVEN